MSGAILKESVKRTVLLEPAADRVPPRIVKRFHASGAWQRRRDRARAERELAAHRELRRLGLPVPEPVEVRRSDDAWELVTEWIEGATSLRSALLGEASWPDAPERIAARLGALLALLHRCGVDHADLHAGNVLLDPRGTPWLVDLADARVRARLSAAKLVRYLVRAAAGARERLSERLRGRFLVAYLRALPPELRAQLDAPRPLAERVERLARAERRRSAHRQRRRWLRPSGVCRAIRSGEIEGLARAGLDPEVLGRIGLALERETRCTWPGDPATEVIALAGLPPSELRARWLVAARLEAHGIAGARPLALLRAPRAAALFALPSAARPLASLPERSTRERARVARALGHSVGSLHDRGLTVPGLALSDFVEDASGVRFGVLRELRDLDLERPDRRAAWAALARELVPSRRERALFASAYAAAHRCGSAERARLRAEVRRG